MQVQKWGRVTFTFYTWMSRYKVGKKVLHVHIEEAKKSKRPFLDIYVVVKNGMVVD